MGPMKHIVASTVLATSVYIGTKSLSGALTCVASGVLVDLDHIIEYGKYCFDYKQKWSWKEFFSGTYFDVKETVYVVFHSWEVAVLLAILLIMKKNGDGYMLFGAFMGYSLHLVLDQIGNNLKKFSYFELYRFKNKYEQTLLIKKMK